MRILLGLTAAGLIALGAQGAQAAILFSDTFAGEPDPGPNGSLNYTGFQNFNVIDGFVDLLETPNSYVVTGTDNFVDLDGSGNVGGQLQTKSSFNFSSGSLVTLSFLASGNQRNSVADNLFGGFDFGPMAPTFSFIAFSGFDSFTQSSNQLLGIDTSVAGAQPYLPYTLSFRSTTAGSFTGVFGTGNGMAGSDNEGPIFDNVLITAIPEPQTWGLMILGFAAVGHTLRSRKRRLVPVRA